MPTSKKVNPADFEEKEKEIEEEEDDLTPKKITSDEGSDTDDAYLDGEDDIIEGDSFDDTDSL